MFFRRCFLFLCYNLVTPPNIFISLIKKASKMKKTTIILIGCLLPVMVFGQTNESTIELGSLVDHLWVLIAAALVFFMQAGFKALETGLVKKEHQTTIGLKNLMDWIIGCLIFFLIGFGFMFGTSAGGFIGTDMFAGIGVENHSMGFIFLLFQIAFAGTALTIISGAMSGRTGLIPYLTGTIITAAVIYPVFGHWVWGNLFVETNEPWLASLGFMDFAGSSVVHSVGAWMGLVGIIVVGPRIGRFDEEGKDTKRLKASNYSYAILGVMILWLGWWGFNGGSALTLDKSVGTIILNTNLAGAAAGLSAFLVCYWLQDKSLVVEKIIGGALTGLVAITAGCNVVTPQGAIVIGLIAGVIHNYGFDLLVKLKLDDPVGAIPVHGFGGAFGTIAVGIFGKSELLMLPRFSQIGVQFLGVVVCFVFTASVAYLMFKLLKGTVGLRVSHELELSGKVLEEIESPIEEPAVYIETPPETKKEEENLEPDEEEQQKILELMKQLG